MLGRQITPAGIDALIKKWERLELVGYLPTPDDEPTAGWGHTGSGVQVGVAYSLDQANAWLMQDLAWANLACDQSILHLPFSHHQFDACVSLCFNIGVGGFTHSTVLRRINAGDLDGAAAAFIMWDMQGGTVLQGLVNRRNDERAWFIDAPD
jgi:lysozyme